MRPGVVAADEPFVRWDWIGDHTDEITEALRQHIQLTVAAVTIGFVLSLVRQTARRRHTFKPTRGTMPDSS